MGAFLYFESWQSIERGALLIFGMSEYELKKTCLLLSQGLDHEALLAVDYHPKVEEVHRNERPPFMLIFRKVRKE